MRLSKVPNYIFVSLRERSPSWVFLSNKLTDETSGNF